MSKAATSPTARLLQSSRLFSLPRPLPIQPELTSGLYRASETATTAHPTHQAITTPASSLSRGDWGLKRPIPKRKTNSSTPAIRVRANDTYEHITDFASAGDHVQTERKWAQMEVPVIHPSSRKSKWSSSEGGPLSVFEEWLDNTDPEANLDDRAPVGGRHAAENPKAMQRWKYAGPWLGGMQDGEFEKYLYETVHHGRSSRSTWPEFLRRKINQEKVQEVRLRARDHNNPLNEEQVEKMIAEIEKSVPEKVREIWARVRDPEDPLGKKEASRLEDQTRQAAKDEFRAYEKRLRDEHASKGLSSDLTALICEFLDLPSVYAGPTTGNPRLGPGEALQLASLIDSAAESGPPTTHPSAGLSHLRTNAIMHNHPIHGPLKERPPVESRVVRPRTMSGKQQEHLAKLGVGGIVADDSLSATSRNPDPRSTRDEDRMAHSLDENVEGGNKMWVHPETAYIDHKSRIQLSVSRAGQEAVAVKMGDWKKIGEIWETKQGSRVPAPAGSAYAVLPERMMARTAGSRSTSSSSAGEPRRYTGVTGFDEELGGGQ